MKYFRSRFNTAFQILEGYNYPEPFHIHLKNYFKLQKKYGSKDRKAIAELCYGYFRTGRTFKTYNLRESLLLSALLIDFDDVSQWQDVCNELGFDYTLPINFFQNSSKVKRLEGIAKLELEFYPNNMVHSSFKHYEDARNVLFRPKNWAKDHTDSEPRILGLPGSLEIQPNANVDQTTQIQDLSSQFICSKIALNENDNVWDVCSGAGGKSLNLLSSGRGSFYLSDVRPQIITNAKARIKSMLYDANFGVIDLSTSSNFLKFENQRIGEGYFERIVADVPCTGSGTWFGTPEHFINFNYDQLSAYVTRQKQIVTNAMPFLKDGGSFYYITCSIFSQENQEMRDWILDTFEVSLEHEIKFNGIEQKADGMYMASFVAS